MESNWIQKQYIDSNLSWHAEYEYMHILCIQPKKTVKITVNFGNIENNCFLKIVIGQNYSSHKK